MVAIAEYKENPPFITIAQKEEAKQTCSVTTQGSHHLDSLLCKVVTKEGKSAYSAFPLGSVLHSNHLVPNDEGKFFCLENSQLIIVAGIRVLGNGHFIRVKMNDLIQATNINGC